MTDSSRTPPRSDSPDTSLFPPSSGREELQWACAISVSRDVAKDLFLSRIEVAAALEHVAPNREPATSLARLSQRARVALFELLKSSRSEADFCAQLERAFVCVRTEDATTQCTGYATIEAVASRAHDASFRFPLLGDLRERAPDLLKLERSEALQDPRVPSLAIAWMEDAFAWALVETNGTALLRMTDGTSKLISRVATNGFAWKGIGRAMAELGALDGSTITLERVREAAIQHPGIAEAAAFLNPRFVSFEVCEASDFPPALPSGTLTAGLSCAADPAYFPFGALLLLTALDGEARTPGFSLRCMQDAGGAIRGARRLDLYCGIGPDAVRTAGEVHVRAHMSLLMLREDCSQLGVQLSD